MYKFSCKRYLKFVCLLDYLVFDFSKSMFKFIIAKMTPTIASEASSRNCFEYCVPKGGVSPSCSIVFCMIVYICVETKN